MPTHLEKLHQLYTTNCILHQDSPDLFLTLEIKYSQLNFTCLVANRFALNADQDVTQTYSTLKQLDTAGNVRVLKVLE